MGGKGREKQAEVVGYYKEVTYILTDIMELLKLTRPRDPVLLYYLN